MSAGEGYATGSLTSLVLSPAPLCLFWVRILIVSSLAFLVSSSCFSRLCASVCSSSAVRSWRSLRALDRFPRTSSPLPSPRLPLLEAFSLSSSSSSSSSFNTYVTSFHCLGASVRTSWELPPAPAPLALTSTVSVTCMAYAEGWPVLLSPFSIPARLMLTQKTMPSSTSLSFFSLKLEEDSLNSRPIPNPTYLLANLETSAD
mmetsp:Transcript_120/g.497  ORF Transcript_120/g.497 Transcript_120/m.497 type:complete len:202 (+) Transcript_120:3245-3850(+)